MIVLAYELDGLLAKMPEIKDAYLIGDMRDGIYQHFQSVEVFARKARLTSEDYRIVIVTDRYEWPTEGRVVVQAGKLGHGITQERANRQVNKAIEYWCYSNGLPLNITIVPWDQLTPEYLVMLRNKILTRCGPRTPEEAQFENAVVGDVLNVMDIRYKGEGNVVMEDTQEATDHSRPDAGDDIGGVQADRGPSGQPGQFHEYEEREHRDRFQSGRDDATVPVQPDSNRGGDDSRSGLETVREEPAVDTGQSGSGEREPQQQEGSVSDELGDTGNRLAQDPTSSPADGGQSERTDNVEAGSSGDQGGCDLPDQPAP